MTTLDRYRRTIELCDELADLLEEDCLDHRAVMEIRSDALENLGRMERLELSVRGIPRFLRPWERF